MNEKILPDDIESKSLSELTDIVNRLIQQLENKKNLEETIDDYQYLIKLNKGNSLNYFPNYFHFLNF